MAVVTESVDGKVRRVKVSYKTTTGVKQEVERPVQKLILLATQDNTDLIVAGECSARYNNYLFHYRSDSNRKL